MHAVVTIEQFQSMMKSEKKDGLWALFERISEAATPYDVREFSPSAAVGPVSDWAGWR